MSEPEKLPEVPLMVLATIESYPDRIGPYWWHERQHEYGENYWRCTARCYENLCVAARRLIVIDHPQNSPEAVEIINRAKAK